MSPREMMLMRSFQSRNSAAYSSSRSYCSRLSSMPSLRQAAA
jgi:hypothetical protein